MSSFETVLTHATQQAPDTVIRFNPTNVIILENVSRATLASDDFSFF